MSNGTAKLPARKVSATRVTNTMKTDGQAISDARQTISHDKKVDIWIEHSNQMWRAIFATPLIGSGIFVGWYAVQSTASSIISGGILVFGMLLMVVQFFIVRRMNDYAAGAKKALDGIIPPPQPALLGITGAKMAMTVPCFLFLIFSALLILQTAGVELVQDSTSTAQGQPNTADPR